MPSIDIKNNISFYRSNISSSRCYQNILSSSDVEWLIDFMFKETGVYRLGSSGNMFFSENFEKIIIKFFDKFNEMIDLSEIVKVGGNFFLTPHQYGFHTDMPEKGDHHFVEGDVAFCTILIPLFHLPQKAKCHFMLFNERILSHGTTLDRGPSKSDTHYNSISNYDEIENLYNESGLEIKYEDKDFDNDLFEKYNMGATSPKERFNGFSIESVYDWTPGDAMVFDTTQLHCSNLGLKKELFKNKAGLRMSFYKNLKNKRDPIDWEKLK